MFVNEVKVEGSYVRGTVKPVGEKERYANADSYGLYCQMFGNLVHDGTSVRIIAQELLAVADKIDELNLNRVKAPSDEHNRNQRPFNF